MGKISLSFASACAMKRSDATRQGLGQNWAGMGSNGWHVVGRDGRKLGQHLGSACSD